MKKSILLAIFAIGLIVVVLISTQLISADDNKVSIVAYVYDLSGGCSNLDSPCKDEELINETYDSYFRLLRDAGINESVSLKVLNLRHELVRNELEEINDPVIEEHLSKPYPLVFVNGNYEVNMEKSPKAFYRSLRPYLNFRQRQQLDRQVDQINSQLEGVETADQMIYFYRVDCPYCVKIEESLKPFRSERFVQYDLADEDNVRLYREYLEKYGYGTEEKQPSTMVPAVFVNDVYLRGSLRVVDYLSMLTEDEPFLTYVIEK